MGSHIDRVEFSEQDHARFTSCLVNSVRAVGELLDRPGFGEGPRSLGAELEVNLVSSGGRPAPVNQAVLTAAQDPRLTEEINRFNLEINAEPVALAGRPFTALARGLCDALSRVRRAAGAASATPVLIGILPTAGPADLSPAALTDTPRYRALSAALRRLHGDAFRLHIAGEDFLDIDVPDVTYEGANTSFQVHLRVDPAEFAAAYNAAQVAAGPALAIGCNSPLFLGRRLWAETRVVLFRQSVDHRRDALVNDWRPARVSFGNGWVRSSAVEQFAEQVALHEALLPVASGEDALARVRAGEIPELGELRLHGGTIWQWNRAVYDPTAGGHLRIEFRALPAGPTVTDMVANAAFFLGLVHALEPRMDQLLAGFLFGHARRNFYQAAQHGLDAELLWPAVAGRRVEPRPAAALIAELVPVAEEGLERAGVASDEARTWLTTIAARAAARMTGARWQRKVFERELRRGRALPNALSEMLRCYLEAGEAVEAGEAGRPLHQWPAP